MLAHGAATRNMPPLEYMGNLVLLIVGGNDTTRNSMTGGLLALNANPGEWAKLRANPALVDSLVPEIIRWQTPLAYMRRTATQDTELGGKKIAKGDKVAMWYISGNRDETVFDRADDLWIDRPNARQHIAFGIGQRLALLGRQRAGNARRVLANQRLELQHDAHARTDWRVLPRGKRSMCGADGCIHFAGRGKRHARQHFLRGGVHDVAPFLRLRFDKLAADQQLDGGGQHGGLVRGVHGCLLEWV
jgi:hypothetical protein